MKWQSSGEGGEAADRRHCVEQPAARATEIVAAGPVADQDRLAILREVDRAGVGAGRWNGAKRRGAETIDVHSRLLPDILAVPGVDQTIETEPHVGHEGVLRRRRKTCDDSYRRGERLRGKR